jgi:DNA-binding response OmpR family regulator
MKLLVVEDNCFYRHALAAALKEWGYKVETAAFMKLRYRL